MAAKIYYLAKERKGKTRIVSGTVKDLTNYFGYTLMCGNSRNGKISTTPKTMTSLVGNLNKSVYETQGGCYDQDYYWAATKEEFELQQT